MLRLPVLRDDRAHKLDEFKLAQGYPASAYLGGEPKILAAFQDQRCNTHGDGVAELAHIKQKALRPEVWDATGHLKGHGAHMPLLFYVGDLPRRSEARLEAREEAMVHRGWRPGSINRWRLMNKGEGGDLTGDRKG